MKTASRARRRRLRFVTDENFSLNLAKILRIFDHSNNTIDIFDESFEKGKPDEEWLSDIAAWIPRPIVLGGDGRILKNAPQLAALHTARTHFVFLAEGFVNLEFQQQVLKLLTGWERICKAVGKVKDPSVFKFTTKSNVELHIKISDLVSAQDTKARKRRKRNQGA